MRLGSRDGEELNEAPVEVLIPRFDEAEPQEAPCGWTASDWLRNLLYNCVSNGGTDFAPPQLGARAPGCSRLRCCRGRRDRMTRCGRRRLGSGSGYWGSRRARTCKVTVREMTSARAIITSAAVHAAPVVMLWVWLKMAIVGPKPWLVL